jgi:DNA topoisomerase IA
VYRSRGSAQEAHEAIRPSEVARDPRSLARALTKDQLALYRLGAREAWTVEAERGSYYYVLDDEKVV